MEDFTKTGVSPPLQGPHWAARPHDKTSPPFPPLKLVTQPSGFAVELTQPSTLVGRHTDADLRLPLPDVSRRHCRFVFADDSWQVVDLDSLNGVFVNGERVERATLRHQDIVVIGGFRFRVELNATSEDPQSPSDSGKADIVNSIAGALPFPAEASGQPQRKAS
jgi:pSer/pThr/pTyr-binding forkhead associated (FHA) protein